MANWVYPLGTAAHGKWDVSIGTSDSELEVTAGPHRAEGRHAGGRRRRRTRRRGGGTHRGAAQRLLRGDGGRAGLPAGRAGQRLQRPQRCALHGNRQGRHHQLGRRRTGGGGHRPAKASYPTRLITAAETPVELRGAGNCSRQVHNFGTPAALEADRFIVCEVLTPAGNWSSYPPHKHDEEKDGETSLEEIYYFETRVTPGAPQRPGGRRRHRLPARLRLRRTSHRRVGRGPDRRRRPGALRLARTRHGRPRLRHVLPQRHGRPGPGPRLARSATTRTTAGSARLGKARTWTRDCRSAARRAAARRGLQPGSPPVRRRLRRRPRPASCCFARLPRTPSPPGPAG